jgi:cysteine desulfurase / selenocysteine lyase
VRDVVFLDFAATAARRPPAVTAAVASFLDDVGASVGRGGHRLANEAGRIALRCRQRVAALLGVDGDAGRIAFMPNATYALNAAIWGTVGRGQRIVVTQLDHNAVLRPAARLATERGAEVVVVPVAADGSLDMAALHGALRGARLFCINAASNVLGTALDVGALCELARGAGALSLVDVAQAAGHMPLHAAGADMIAFTGHKGMLGPPGIGGLWVRPGVDIDPIMTGGTGGDSSLREMPAALPDRLEAGTLNGAGIAGLLAGIDHVLQEGVAALHQRLSGLKLQLHDALGGIAGIRVLSPPAPSGVPIVSVTCDTIDTASFAARLDREHGVLVRAGLHCAPEAHRVLGTLGTGTVRFSLGWCSTAAEVEHAVAAVAAIAATPRVSA